jgi:hypothetical protein
VLHLQTLLQVSSYCASAVMILANLLADGKHIAPSLSHGGSHFMKNASYHLKITFMLSQYFGLFVLSDLPFLEGLFDILPLVCDDNQARNALWCILARLLAQAQGIDMNSSSLKHFVSLLLGKFTLIKDDLESHRVDKEVELSAEDAYFKHGVSTSVSFLKNTSLLFFPRKT